MPYLLAGLLLLAPAYIIKLNLFGLPTDVLMLSVFLFWIIFGGWLLAKKLLPDFIKSVFSLNKSLRIYIGLFFLSGIISLFLFGSSRQKLGQFIVLFLQPLSVFFISRFLTEKFPSAKNFILSTLYFLLSLAGLYAILQYFTLIGLPPAWQGNTEEPKRALSFFIHPNFYALFTAPLLAFLIPDVVERTKNWKLEIGNWKFITAWLIGALGLFFSLSRAGWLGLGVAILIYLIFAANNKIRKTVFAAVIIIVMVIISVPNFRFRLLLPFYGEKSTVSRLSLWQTGLKGIKLSPVFGLGLTGFAKQWPTLNTDAGLTEPHNFPHNIFLDLWVETGLLGLISLIGLMSIFIYRGLLPSPPLGEMPSASEAERVQQPSYKKIEPLGHHRLIKLSIALFLIALLSQGLIDNPYFKNDLAVIFWLILSLLI